MIEFTDGEGRTWHPRFTFTVIREARRKTGVRLFDLAGSQELTDPDNLLQVVYLTIRDEAAEAGVEYPDFLKSMENGPARPMIDAFNQALGEFMHGPKDERKEDDEDAASDEDDDAENPT